MTTAGGGGGGGGGGGTSHHQHHQLPPPVRSVCTCALVLRVVVCTKKERGRMRRNKKVGTEWIETKSERLSFSEDATEFSSSSSAYVRA